MNAMAVTREYRMAQWAQVMQDRKESGESIKAYCQTRGIERSSYFYWQRKLRRAACDQIQYSQGEAGQKSLIPEGFTQVWLGTAHRKSLGTDSKTGGSIEAEVAGIRLRADSGYPEEKMARLLRELVRLC